MRPGMWTIPSDWTSLEQVHKNVLSQVRDGHAVSLLNPDGEEFARIVPVADAGAAEVLRASEQRTQVSAMWHAGVPVGPAPGQPIFGHDGREIAGEYGPDMRPLTSFCRCGRQVTTDTSEWAHSD